MAQGAPGRNNRPAGPQRSGRRYRRSVVRRPVNWPAHMVAKRLRNGDVAYYWNPHVRYLRAGFPLHREALGRDYALAIARAVELNRHLDDWRRGREAVRDLDLQPGFGTLAWLIERYKRSPAYTDKVSTRSREEYDRAFRLVLSHPLASGAELGSVALEAISARGVDKLYAKLRIGKRVAKRLRQANLCMMRMARAWDAVRRLYPKVVPAENPFRGVELQHGHGTTRAASRAEAYALHAALVAAGEQHLAAVPLVCFEWQQRPENVLAGHLAWSDYKPTDRPDAVRVFHHKTGEVVFLPLLDKYGSLFPELISDWSVSACLSC